MEKQEEVLRERTLTLINYGTEKGKTIKTRVTLQASMVQAIIASYESTPYTKENLDLHKVNVIMGGGDNIELFLTVLDLTTLERAIGAYFLAD